MLKKLLNYYKIPLLISACLSITVIALTLVKRPLDISMIALGAIAGSFLLDLDYLLYTYFLEPEADFSRTTAAHLKNKEYNSAFSYINHHKNDIGDKTLNSVLFQVVLAGATLLVTSSNSGFFVKLLIISAFVNSLYRLAEHYFANNTDLWFWALKVKPDRKSIMLYSVAMVMVLLVSLTFIQPVYGFLISIGILASTLVTIDLAKKSKLNSDIVWEILPPLLVISIIGARLYHVLDYWELYSRSPVLILKIWHGGLGIYGSLICGLIGLISMLKTRKQKILPWLNIVAISVPLAQSIGRFGNMFNKELYGNWIFPFFLLESFFDFTLFLLLLLYYRKYQRNTLALYLLGYGIIRFILEFSRTDSWILSGVNVTQTVSIVFIICGGILLGISRKTSKMIE